MQHSALVQTVIVVAFAATLWQLGRNLPVQNVLSVAALIILFSGILQIIAEKTGRFFFTENLGYKLFNMLPWPIPLLWVVVLLNSRGVARIILKPRRNSANYGIWSIALTGLLVVLFDIPLEAYALEAHWIGLTGMPIRHGAAWARLAGLAVAAILILVLVTPWLINKKPTREPAPDLFPVWIWLTLFSLLAIANVARHP